MDLQEMYGDLWNKTNELLIAHPELSELWLDRETLATIRARYPSRDEQQAYYRRRAFAAMIIERLFRIYREKTDYGLEDEEGITLNNAELERIWREDLQGEYEAYPEFVTFVENQVLKAGNENE